jgi:hypothetical protein
LEVGELEGTRAPLGPVRVGEPEGARAPLVHVGVVDQAAVGIVRLARGTGPLAVPRETSAEGNAGPPTEPLGGAGRGQNQRALAQQVPAEIRRGAEGGRRSRPGEMGQPESYWDNVSAGWSAEPAGQDEDRVDGTESERPMPRRAGGESPLRWSENATETRPTGAKRRRGGKGYKG